VPDPPLAPGQTRLDAWNIVNLERINHQVSVPLLPAYIQQSPGSTQIAPPYRSEPQLDLTEGPHFSYALQWFTFAAILAIGYPIYVRRQTSNVKKDMRTAQKD
jgi:surfeit locus 1 family protein